MDEDEKFVINTRLEVMKLAVQTFRPTDYMTNTALESRYRHMVNLIREASDASAK